MFRTGLLLIIRRINSV